MPISILDFKNKIIRKIKRGFEVTETSKRHIRYKIWYKGKKVAETYCSHGSSGKEIYDKILPDIKRQLKLDNTKQLYELKECPMSVEDYFNLLKQKNVISD